MADGTILQFQADLQKFADAIGLSVAEVVRVVSLQIFTGVIEKTPVDTGRARASWSLSLDTPGDYVAPEGEYGAQGGADYAQRQTAVLNGVTKENPYHEVWVYNNVEYISFLNLGHSQQAPAGFVELTLAEVGAEIDATMEAIAQRNLK